MVVGHPSGWKSSLAMDNLSALGLVISLLAGFWILFVLRHPVRITETGVAQWPFVCVTWDEIDAYMFCNMGLNRPVIALNLVSKRWGMPMFGSDRIRVSQQDAERIRRLMAHKGIPETAGRSGGWCRPGQPG